MAYFGKLCKAVMQKAVSSELRTALRQPQGQMVGAAAIPALFMARGMATAKLFIGGLSWGADEKTLRDAFSSFGEIIDVRIITDRDTGRSRGFGFVSFSSEAEAQAALQEMDGRDVAGRPIRVDYATDRTAEGGAPGGFGRGGGPGGFSSRGPPGGAPRPGGNGGGGDWRGF